jgi:hypothetical protein
VLGPTWAGFAFAAFGSSWPFLSGALILIPVTLAALALARHVKARGAGA